MVEIVQAIDPQSMEKIKALIAKYDLDYLMDSEWNYSLYNRNDALAKLNDKIDGLGLAQNVAMTKLDGIIKCNLLNIPDEIEPEIEAQLKKLPVSIVRHEGTASLDLTAQEINKYSTFRKYFPNHDYIAFGNDANDLEMLKHAKLAVVVGQNQHLKEIGQIHLSADDKELAECIGKI